MNFERRTFFQLCSACAAFLAGGSKQQAQSAPQAGQPAQSAPQAGRQGRGGGAPQGGRGGRGAGAGSGAVKHRKNFVAIQVRPYAWIDEGIDSLLDNIQNKGGVNTIWAYTYDYAVARLSPSGSSPLPDHGRAVRPGDSRIVGGAFYDYDQKYFSGTSLKDFRSTDFGKFNVISEVAPKAKARGMDFFCWDYNTRVNSIPNIARVMEVDINGRRTASPCFNHPDYRAHLTGKIESYLREYGSMVDGIAWGCERMGSLGTGAGGHSCFCEHCQAKAKERGLSMIRAQMGFRAMDEVFRAAAQDQRPSDGYLVSFWRVLLKYPEVLGWEQLWTDGYHEARQEVYGMAKAVAPEKPFGFHIMQHMTFSPFYRAEEDYSETKNYTDFLKLATYSNAGGPRLAAFLERLSATVLHDCKPQDFMALFYKVMNYQGGSIDELPSAGLPASYVAQETKRAIAGVAGSQVKIYPGIDVDVPSLVPRGGPPRPTDKKTAPDDVRQATRAAFDAGADGVVLCREYVEMWLANLSAAGDTLRDIFSKQTPG